MLVLAPSELARIFGDGPSLFIAPMRDLVIALPGDAEPGLAAWLYAEVAADDPNCLAPMAFRFEHGRVLPGQLFPDTDAAEAAWPLQAPSA